MKVTEVMPSSNQPRAMERDWLLFQAEIKQFRALVARLSDCLSDEGADWSNEGLHKLRTEVADLLPSNQLPDWLLRYRTKPALEIAFEAPTDRVPIADADRG